MRVIGKAEVMADTRDTRERILRQLDAEIDELEEQRTTDSELDEEAVDREKERAELANRNQP